MKNEKEIFKMIMDTYEKNIITYDALVKKTGKTQKHRKLKEESYEKEVNDALVNAMKENKLLNDKIKIELKLGAPYNRSYKPWIQLYYLEKNSKGTTGNYTGISIDIEKGNIELWIGFGKSKLKKFEILDKKEKLIYEYKKMYGEHLSRGFDYTSVFVDATIISKIISIDKLDNEEFRKDIAYLTDIYISFESKNNFGQVEEESKTNKVNITFAKSNKLMGRNILYKGFPGVGKSYRVMQEFLMDKNGKMIDGRQYERVTFYSEYSNAEFIGTIRPCIKNSIPTYSFVPGPFTNILKRAINNKDTNFYLIIEEINRGEAASIFGDIFQLLDRKNNDGESVYEITNSLIAQEVYGDENKKIRIPNNLSIIATMNVSDENVKILDNAFERRWETIWVLDSIGKFDDKYIKGMQGITWGKFRKIINNAITSQEGILKNEDKQLGPYYINEEYVTDTSENNEKGKEKFLYKVIINLFTKICKYDKNILFDEKIKTIDNLVDKFLSRDYLDVFKEDIKNKLLE